MTVTCLSSPAPRPHAHPWPRLPPRPPRRCCRALRTNHKSTIAYDKSYNICLRVVSWFHGFISWFHGFTRSSATLLMQWRIMRLFSIITTVSSTSSAERRKRQLTKASCAVKHRLSVRPNSTVTPSGVAHTVTLRRAWLKHEQRFFEWSLTAKLTGFKLNESDGRIISGS